MAAPHSTPDQYLKAALPYLVYLVPEDFFFFVIIRSPGSGDTALKELGPSSTLCCGAWEAEKGSGGPGSCDPST